MNCSTGIYLILDTLIRLPGLPFLFPKCSCDFVSGNSMILSFEDTALASKPKLLQKDNRHWDETPKKIFLNR